MPVGGRSISGVFGRLRRNRHRLRSVDTPTAALGRSSVDQRFAVGHEVLPYVIPPLGVGRKGGLDGSGSKSQSVMIPNSPWRDALLGVQGGGSAPARWWGESLTIGIELVAEGVGAELRRTSDGRVYCPGRGREVDLLLSMVADWEEFDPLDGRVVAFRAVEIGVAVVRQPQRARSVKVDGYGCILGGACGLRHQRSAWVPTWASRLSARSWATGSAVCRWRPCSAC